MRATPAYAELVDAKMRLGSEAMMEVGNLYTAALPAWLAAGLEDALRRGEDLAEREILTIGYGSGDAAEAIPMRVVPDWRAAAGRIGFDGAFAGAVDLSREQYEALHAGARATDLPGGAYDEFVIDRVGSDAEPLFDESGIEYYRYCPPARRRAAG